MTRKLRVLELFAGTKSIGKAAEELGYEVFSSDFDEKFDTDYPVDILKFDVNKVPWQPDIIWASPPCTSFSIAAVSRHWTKERTPKSETAILGYKMIEKTLEIIDYFQPTFWYIENPRGLLRKFPIMEELPIRNTVTYCFKYDTEIITMNGVFKIGKLENTIQTLLTKDGEWVSAPIKNYGKQHLMKITLSRAGKKKYIYATPYHKWLTNKGIIETQDLNKGIRLDYAKIKKQDCKIIDEYVARGFTYGDGWNLKTKPHGFVMFCDEKQEMLSYFDNIGNKRWNDDTNTNSIVKLYGTPLNWKTEMPLMDDEPSKIFSWLSGYLAADGSVHISNGQVTLSSSKKEDLIHVRNLCRIIGIGTYSIVEYLRKGYGKQPTILYQMTFMRSDIPDGFILRKKHKVNFEKVGFPKHQPRKWVVKNIEMTDLYEDVYCAEVSDTHSFALEDDILTHNCQYGNRTMKPTDIWTNNEHWIPRPMCKNGQPCHEAAPRGSNGGITGYKNAMERSRIPHELCLEVLSQIK